MNITNRTTHDVQQGTGPWLRLREGFFTASEAPAALGVSKYVTRAELLRVKHTGVAQEHSSATLGKFAAGHAAEAEARPLAESVAQGDLYPVTMSAIVDGLPLLASLDGLRLDDEVVWETKLWNEELAAAVLAAPDGSALPEHYRVQMDQELLVSGASRCLFTCTDGTPERFVSCSYEANPARFAALVEGWRHFAADLAAYVLPPSAPAAPVGRAPETLPALRIDITGAVTESNLPEFKATALAAIRSVNRDLRTDVDFANAEASVKWCSEVEAKLAAAKEHALSQTATIDALFKAIDEISAEARRVRLDLDKLVTRRKSEVKDEAVAAARKLLEQHIATLNAELAPMRVPQPVADFAGAIKGKRSIASMQDALDGVLTVAKIAAEADARAIRANVATFQREAAGVEFLFADLGQIVHKAADDFQAVLQARIATHRAAEAEREAKRIAAEAARLAAQQAEDARVAALAEQRRQDAAAEAVRVAAAAPAGAPAPLSSLRGMAQMPAGETSETIVEKSRGNWAAKPAAPEPATLKLGVICERLGFTLTAAFVSDVLGIAPARVDGASRLFTERQFAAICERLVTRIRTVQAERQAVEA